MKPHTQASDMLIDGWLPPNAAAAALGITLEQLTARYKRGELKRRSIVPGVYLYEVDTRWG